MFASTSVLAFVIIVGLWLNLILPSLIIALRRSQLPWTGEPNSEGAATAKVVAAPGSPAYVSNLLQLGSASLAGIHRAARIPSPGFDRRMRSSRILSVATGLVATALVFLVPAWLGRGSFAAGAGLAVIIVATFGAEKVHRGRRSAILQGEEDRWARAISEQLRGDIRDTDDGLGDFGLYLRSFITTNQLKVEGVDLETQIAHAINQTLPIVALGNPGEHEGAGRIETTDEEWRREVVRLMDATRLILLLPSDRAGTMWEIEELRRRRLLDRTIFIMPPELRWRGSRFSATWNRTVAALGDAGFQVPPHFPKGLFFSVDAEGRFLDHAPFIMDPFFDDSIRNRADAESLEESEDDRDDGERNDQDPLDAVVAAAVLGIVFEAAAEESEGGGSGDGPDLGDGDF